MKKIWEKIQRWLKPEYKITVYRKSDAGNTFTHVHNVSKILIQKEKHLKFKEHESGKWVEFRSAEGLTYTIEEL